MAKIVSDMATMRMTPPDVRASVWKELRVLGNSSPLNDQDLYEDHVAYESLKQVSMTVGPLSDLPRDYFITFFSLLAEGPLLNELLDLLKGSRRHPALQYATLLVLHGAAELTDKRMALLSRQDAVGELLHVMASPQRRRITPSASFPYFVNSAGGAMSTITGLFTSNTPGLEPRYARVWIDLGAVPSLASSLESHSEFDQSNTMTADIPLLMFAIATSLLASAASAGVPVATADKVRLSAAVLTLFVDRTELISDHAATNLAALFSRTEWLLPAVDEIPVELRKVAVAAARRCELAGGAWKSGDADELALALSRGNAKVQDSLFGKMCSGPGCGNVQQQQSAATKTDAAAAGEGVSTAPFKRCSRCHAKLYCSRECQAAHWKVGHKRECVSRSA